jgi:SPP1 gp7 family putative phage head morphogenesis protein
VGTPQARAPQRAPRAPQRARPTSAQVQAARRDLAADSARVAALPLPALASLAPVLQQVRREVVNGFSVWLSEWDPSEPLAGPAYRGLLLRLRPALDASRGLGVTLAHGLEAADAAALVLAVSITVREVAALSHLIDGVAVRLPLVARVASGASNRWPRYRSSAARYAGQVGEDLRREIAVGLVRGETVSALTTRLSRRPGFRAAVGAGPIGDRFRDRWRYWAERLVRTEVAAAYNDRLDGVIREARAWLPDLQRRLDASLDLRVCRLCASLHGTVVGLNEPFPGGYEGAPIHPNCRCRVGAWRAEWSEILRDAES